MEIFEYLFGQSGTAVDFFGGNWWLVGIFFLVIFALVLFTEGAGSNSIALILLVGSVLIVTYPIFTLIQTIGYFQVIVFIVLILAGWYYYRWLNR